MLNAAAEGLSLDNPDTSQAKILGGSPCVFATGPKSADTPYYQCANFDTLLPVGGRGSLGANTYRKDGTANFNLAFGRTFHLPGGERTMEFRSEFLNLMNSPQFDKPGVNVSNGTFGKIVNTINKGRQVQFSVKLSF